MMVSLFVAFVDRNNLGLALPKMKEALGPAGEGIDVRFEFDQSPYVTRAVKGVVMEGLLGAFLVGLMILLFLRDWRSSLIVVLNIPFALMAAVLALWITGQTINLMTLGGLALAIGILVDEATVEIENIHSQMYRTHSIARAGNKARATSRAIARVCCCAANNIDGRPGREIKTEVVSRVVVAQSNL